MNMLPMVILPGAALVVRTAAQLTKIGATGGRGPLSGALSGGILQKALAAIGVIELADLLGFNIFGGQRDDEDALLDLISELTDSGYIQVPGVRRDGTTGANNWLHWNIDDDSARPFLTSEYIGRNFVQAIRRNERTPRYTGRPRPRGRTSRGS